LAAEKVRCKQLKEQLTQEIRAQTVRAMEPQIGDMIKKHKQEKLKLEEMVQQKMREVKDDLQEAHTETFHSMKSKLKGEHEDALDQERERYQAKL